MRKTNWVGCFDGCLHGVPMVRRAHNWFGPCGQGLAPLPLAIDFGICEMLPLTRPTRNLGCIVDLVKCRNWE